MKFTELSLQPALVDALQAMRFSECTPIQQEAIPHLMAGRDLVGVAQTGTGKTAAYLLPVLNELAKGELPANAINCVIMLPTRELAQQIDRQVEGFAYFTSVTSVAIYGGNDGIRFAQEKRGLTMGADIVIATPGRLLSHITMGYVDLSRVSFFILDEADRMLDMGFSDDIMQIARLLPTNRQTMLFSATMPGKIRQLAQSLLHDPVEVKLAVSKPADKIIQSAYVCYEAQKLPLVQHLFTQHPPKRVLVFSSKKQKVKELAKAFARLHINVSEMHSDLDQKQRDEVMLQFKNGHVDVLVATDIVARGIDIDDISLVLNYDVPHDAEDYVHRIGRTARAEHDGAAITFVSEQEQRAFAAIESFLQTEITKQPLPESLGEAPAYKGVSEKKRNASHRWKRRGAKAGAQGKASKESTPRSAKRRNRKKARKDKPAPSQTTA